MSGAHTKWNVYLGRKLLTAVFFVPSMTAEEVTRALVNHDGFDAGIVTRVARLVDGAEYKRRQSPPGVRITAKAFGKDRRMPITNRYRDRVPQPVEDASAGGR